MNIKTILVAGFSAMVVMVLGVAGYAVFNLQNINWQLETVLNGEVSKSLLAWEIMNDHARIADDMKGISGLKNSESTSISHKALLEDLHSIEVRIDRLRDMEDGQGKLQIERVQKDFSEYHSLLNQIQRRSVSPGSESGLSNLSELTEDARLKLRVSLLEYIEHQKSDMVAAQEKSRQTLANSQTMMALMVLGSVLLAALLGFQIVRILYAQIGGEPRLIGKVTRQLSEGDLGYEFPANTKGIFHSIRILATTMAEVAGKAREVEKGNFGISILPKSEKDQLGNSLAGMIKTLRELARVASEIAEGKFTERLQVKGEDDLVSKAINRMSATLDENERRYRDQTWLKDGLNELGTELSGNRGTLDICSSALNRMSRYLEAGRACFFLNEPDNKELQLVSSFAYTERELLSNRFAHGQGVVGQVAVERQPILLTLPGQAEGLIHSGTVAKTPACTYTFPVVYEDRLIGVIEFASFRPFRQAELEYLNRANGIIAPAIYSAQQRERIGLLFEEAQKARVEAEEKSLKLQEANTLMEEQQQQITQQSHYLQESNARLEEQQQQLQQQSEELQQTNAQLEEQQQQLLQQTEELRQGNEQLTLAKDQIDLKARELEQSNRYKSDFLANMSHELRTPLNSIILLSKMMQKNERGNFTEDDLKRSRVIHSAGEELLRLINDILDISKIEAGKTTLRLTRFHTGEMIDHLKQYFGSGIKSKGLKLQTEDTLQVDLWSDKDKIYQILRNFVSNAVKFTKEGQITIRISGNQDPLRPVKITVSDTGIGIPEEKHHLIFEAFQQVDTSISREFGGTGLGLTISQKLATLLGGHILMESSPGKGSAFSLCLPLRLETEEDTPSPEVPGTQTQSMVVKPAFRFDDDRNSLEPGDKVIMIVEDDPHFAEMVAMVVRSLNMKALYAMEGEEALVLVCQYKVHGIVLDLVLPDMNGVDFMRRLKGFKELRHIPVQIVSGHEKNPELIRMGALDFFQKPIDQDQIRRALEEILTFSSKSPKDLLIVEDNLSHREALIELIKSPEIQITGVATEEEACRELDRGIYDAVIIDLGLHSGSGLNICRHARDKDLRVPLIVYTGQELTPEEEKHIKKMADRIIIKTVHSENRLLDELMLFLHQTRKEPTKAHKPSPQAGGPAGSLTGKTLLVVDDDIKNVFVLSTALEEHGARVLDAQNGEEALKMLEGHRVDLVFMDIMMPVMDGFTAIQKIRENPKTKPLPVIALTAKALKDDRDKCIAAGADDYLAKPVDYDMLIGLATAWCQKKS